jgi:hypothetical protein
MENTMYRRFLVLLTISSTLFIVGDAVAQQRIDDTGAPSATLCMTAPMPPRTADQLSNLADFTIFITEGVPCELQIRVRKFETSDQTLKTDSPHE